jgi:hypothetical protein
VPRHVFLVSNIKLCGIFHFSTNHASAIEIGVEFRHRVFFRASKVKKKSSEELSYYYPIAGAVSATGVVVTLARSRGKL